MQRLPVGVQSFEPIRTDNYCYIDKTKVIHELLTRSGRAVILSRPRRFGKSLLCSTLKAIFEGKRDLFHGLAIDELEWDWHEYPVIYIDLNSGDYLKGYSELESTLSYAFQANATKYGVSVVNGSFSTRLATLISDISRKYDSRVVVIVDEYDKPLLNTMEMPELHLELRSALKGFYSVLKSSDEYLKFSFLTGVTKFAQVSIFSDLNNLDDITLNPKYADICGITQNELLATFAEEINICAENNQLSREAYLDKVKHFYNGYRFTRKEFTVYNTFGLLNHFLNEGEFNPYWYETGTPTFLINLVKNQHLNLLDLEHEMVDSLTLQRFDVANMRALPILYQSGYLTIIDYDSEPMLYTLGYPNDEVRSAFSQSLLEHYYEVSGGDMNAFVATIPRALMDGNVDKAIGALVTLFAGIPYDIQIPRETYYQSMIHLSLRMLGLRIGSEVCVAAGRIDSLLETRKFVYCFEFKLRREDSVIIPTVQDALNQIDEKDYLTPWNGSGKKLFKVGIVFDEGTRNITDWAFTESK
ncbi:MAG: ATP-binding protein [Clostridiales Family XIII bacterium]|jgi:hypothetical protein|nr:ATP-binding protein [Clostridiales Family XIII bacterium]